MLYESGQISHQRKFTKKQLAFGHFSWKNVIFSKIWKKRKKAQGFAKNVAIVLKSVLHIDFNIINKSQEADFF